MFCIKCGKQAVIENLCEKCFLESEALFTIEDFRLHVCDCGSYYDNRWQRPEAEDRMISSQINRRIKTRNKILTKSIDIKKSGNRIIATIICSGLVKPAKEIKKEKRIITITLKRRKCDNCVKILGGYYDAVLQLRGSRTKKILGIVKELAPEAVQLGGIIELKHGYDIRFMEKGIARRIAKQLKRSFDVKESFKFVATKKGKKLYRNYYSIK